jgi:hypothetical protein
MNRRPQTDSTTLSTKTTANASIISASGGLGSGFPRFIRIELYSRKPVARYQRFFGANLSSKSFLPLKNLVA